MSDETKRLQPSGELNLVVEDLTEFVREDDLEELSIDPLGLFGLKGDPQFDAIAAAGLNDEETLGEFAIRLETVETNAPPKPRADALLKVRNQTVALVPHVGQYLLLLLPKKFRENLVGDLEEEYRTIVLPQYGPHKAKLWYWSQVLSAVVRAAWPAVLRFVGVEAFLRMIR